MIKSSSEFINAHFLKLQTANSVRQKYANLRNNLVGNWLEEISKDINEDTPPELRYYESHIQRLSLHEYNLLKLLMSIPDEYIDSSIIDSNVTREW